MSFSCEPLTAEAAHAAVRAQLDAVDAAYERLRSTGTDLAGNAFRIEAAERLEFQQRVSRGLSYRFLVKSRSHRRVCTLLNPRASRFATSSPGG